MNPTSLHQTNQLMTEASHSLEKAKKYNTAAEVQLDMAILQATQNLSVRLTELHVRKQVDAYCSPMFF